MVRRTDTKTNREEVAGGNAEAFAIANRWIELKVSEDLTEAQEAYETFRLRPSNHWKPGKFEFCTVKRCIETYAVQQFDGYAWKDLVSGRTEQKRCKWHELHAVLACPCPGCGVEPA